MTSEKVARSVAKFKESGGRILQVRLNPVDQSLLDQMTVQEGETAAAVLRKALRAYKEQTSPPPSVIPKTGASPMRIISIVNSKGGVGKSTLTISLADALSARGRSVVIIDTDLQKSTMNWKMRRDENHPDLPVADVYSVDTKFTRETLTRSFSNYDFVLIDGAGGKDTHLDLKTICAIASADVVLLPMGTSMFDIDQTLFTIDMIKQRQAMADGMPLARTLITRAMPSKKTYKDMLKFFLSQDLVKLENDLVQRTLHESLPVEGLSAIYSGDRKMVDEINAIADEVEAFFVDQN